MNPKPFASLNHFTFPVVRIPCSCSMLEGAFVGDGYAEPTDYSFARC
jgi:hypothetical protein